jgi:hypothetical protein
MSLELRLEVRRGRDCEIAGLLLGCVLEDVLKVSNLLHLPPFLVCPKGFKPPEWGTLNLRTPKLGGWGAVRATILTFQTAS